MTNQESVDAAYQKAALFVGLHYITAKDQFNALFESESEKGDREHMSLEDALWDAFDNLLDSDEIYTHDPKTLVSIFCALLRADGIY